MTFLEDRFGLSGKTALVTGTSRGIGRSTAIALARAGADVVLMSRKVDDTDTLRIEIEKIGRKVYQVAADSADRNAVIDAGKSALEATTVDILVNNAGTITRSPAIDTELSDWDLVIDVNLNSIFALSQVIAKPMLERGSGKIINIASLLSFQGGINVPAYTSSKHAIQGLTRALANEWSSKGVNVNAIAPGYIETDNTAPLRADASRFESVSSRIPVGRWGTPEDLESSVVFLASDGARYIHGHTLVVDGGWLAR